MMQILRLLTPIQLSLAFLAFAMFIPAASAAAPTVSSFTPADDKQNAATSTSELKITFDQAVQGSTGNITLHKEDDDSQVEQIAGNSSQVSGSGTSTLTISLTSKLGSSNTSYYVKIGSDAVINGSGEAYAGISDTTTWNFKTLFIRGSASRLERLERIRNAQPTYYDREPPSLSEVGIFVPDAYGETPSETSQNTTKDETDETSEEQSDDKKDEDEAAEKQPVDDKPREEVQEYVSNIHRRVCKRVERRFLGNEKMLKRVNRRLRGRFNFECDL